MLKFPHVQAHQQLHCYSGHGGTPIDQPLLSFHTVQMCARSCAHAAGCAGFVMRAEMYASDCWLLSALEPSQCVQSAGFDTYAYADGFENAPAETEAVDSWLHFSAFNCFASHGGTPLSTTDAPLLNLTLTQCVAACERVGCAAVVRPMARNDSGHAGAADCFVLSAVQLDLCTAGDATAFI